jgi:sulfur carrier protein ThiS adenylyltransferase
MEIKLNGKMVDVESDISLSALKAKVKPDADIVILNGAPVKPETKINQGDEVVLIRRGETPTQEEFETLMVARHTPGVHEKIKKACVGIAGLGGLGSAVTIALARLGVGRLVLADFDVIEPSNLNRQQYFIGQLGQFKTEAMEKNLANINPYLKVTTHNVRLDTSNIPGIFKNVDVLVEAFDAAEAKAMLLESFALAYPEKPIVMASGLAGHGPGRSLGINKMGKNKYVIGDLESGARPGMGLMAPRVGIAAHLQANTVLRLLLGEEGE